MGRKLTVRIEGSTRLLHHSPRRSKRRRVAVCICPVPAIKSHQLTGQIAKKASEQLLLGRFTNRHDPRPPIHRRRVR